MKKCFCLLLLVTGVKYVSAQMRLPHYADSLFSTYYWQRVSHFRSLPATTGDIVFLGNSITDGAEWSELFGQLNIRNRGISGDVSAGVLNRLDEVAQRRPAKVFLLIGVNDLARNISPDSVLKNIVMMADYLKQESPATQLYVQSILPVSDAYGKFTSHTGKTKQIRELNESLRQRAVASGYTFIDLHAFFTDSSGKLKQALSNDGLHLLGNGYLLWKHLIYPYVAGLQNRVSLLPLPQQWKRQPGFFPLHACTSIAYSDASIQPAARILAAALHKKGIAVQVNNTSPTGDKNAILLKLGPVTAPRNENEAYRIDIHENAVTLTANTAHGIFNGIQTLLQLAADGALLDAGSITDWPAFAWRGYMVDVGRNYMSMPLLKEQIDVMARYKLNVFHFHPTEDIAWRLESKIYPALNAPENMLRNKGMYYTEADIKELIAYCRERHILFLPEIDMPGHSAAFRRALHTDMQTDSGMAMLKNILRAFCSSYDVPYIHIGADEVTIHRPDFIPAMTQWLQQLGKKVIGWQPGGNFLPGTVRQLWMDDHGKITGADSIPFIDSRHLYINHMDPLESVVSIFNRQLASRNNGDAWALGAELCLWHDRAVRTEADMLQMNPVYPAMLAFAERSWRGGGQPNWIANISDGDVAAFAEFEGRLLDQKRMHFSGRPFPYQQQSPLEWKLYGPYKNGGDGSRTFAPELPGFDSSRFIKKVTGGTIVLRHWWAPLIKGAITQAQDSSTVYAVTKIWSDADAEQAFWIGFNNLSRSPATDAPPAGAWDVKGSELWVNGKKIDPPQWQRAGQRGNAEIPLTDEGYEYRAPTMIQMIKGWNTVLIKAPVESFKGRDWQNPVKWMFSFVPVRDN